MFDDETRAALCRLTQPVDVFDDEVIAAFSKINKNMSDAERHANNEVVYLMDAALSEAAHWAVKAGLTQAPSLRGEKTKPLYIAAMQDSFSQGYDALAPSRPRQADELFIEARGYARKAGVDAISHAYSLNRLNRNRI